VPSSSSTTAEAAVAVEHHSKTEATASKGKSRGSGSGSKGGASGGSHMSAKEYEIVTQMLALHLKDHVRICIFVYISLLSYNRI
jgi:hypothetical protein